MPERKKTATARAEKEIIKEDIDMNEMSTTEDIDSVDDSFEMEEEGIFPNGSGPPQSMIDLWKERYGKVYMTEVEDEEYFVWRVLTRLELKEFNQDPQSDSLYREEQICEKCILWPKDYIAMKDKAGTPSVLAEQIFEKSGFVAMSGPIPL